MFRKKRGKFNGTDSQEERDEALFAVLKANKRAKRRKRIRTAVILLVLLTIGGTVAVRYLRTRVREQFVINTQEVLSTQAERGTISTVVSGSGMLVNVDTETVTVPAGVEITEILVSYGDSVAEGELLATADPASVRTALAQLQEEIEDLDDQIADAEGDKVSSYVYAGVPGRVKAIYAAADTKVEDAMVEHGCLAIVSLDGFMAVDIPAGALSQGDEVTVRLSDGSTKGGTVESIVGDTATVLITDNGPEYGENVTVLEKTGGEIGSGELYIHSPLRITGYAGTVSYVNVSLNQQVWAASSLFTLKDTATSASYDALLRSRSEKEEALLELLLVQRNGGITAPVGGSVFSVTSLSNLDSSAESNLLVLSPDVSMSVTISVDEGDILSLELGQTADITVSSVSDAALKGTVTEIDKTDTSGAYTAVVTLDKVSGMLPGMTASVEVRIEGVDDAILIPVEALHQTSTGYYVYTSYDEETQVYGGKVDVIPGISNSTSVEIKSGLNEGDTVYYTETEDPFAAMGFGDFGGNMPDMSNMGGGNMPDMGNMGGGNSFGGGNGGNNFGGGGGRDNFGGQMPGGRG